jgi:integrase
MILLLLRTGMRIGELLNTKIREVHLAERRIDIFEAQKSRAGRVVYISDDALCAPKRWLKVRKPIDDSLFYGYRGRPLSCHVPFCGGLGVRFPWATRLRIFNNFI